MLCRCRDSLCDFTGDVYPEDYQAAWRGCKVSALSVAQAQANMNGSMPNGVPPAVYQFPPVLSAAAWAAQVRLNIPVFHCQARNQ